MWFLAFVAGCAVVAGLTLTPHDPGRWIALSILAVVYLASAIHHERSDHPSRKWRESRVRGDGSRS